MNNLNFISPEIFISLSIMFLLILGVFSSSLMLIDILTLDKFAALVRWSNEQNNENLNPYIRKTKFFRFFASLRDLIFMGTISLIFLTENLEYFKCQ